MHEEKAGSQADTPVSVQRIPCPYCGADDFRFWIRENGYDAVQCVKCRLVYVNPRPVADLIQSGVETGVHEEVGSGRSFVGRRAEWKLHRYRRVFGSLFKDVWEAGAPVRWLDVGAGFGEVVETVQALAPAGSVVEGIEPMEPKARAARAAGLAVRQGYLDATEAARYDFISLIHVFSHLPDFRPLLSAIHATLSPRGGFYLETGNIADLEGPSDVPTELNLPDHLVFAGESHIRGYLDEAGFDVVAIEYGRNDTWKNLAKAIVKRALGRQVSLVRPGASKYRAIRIRAIRRD
jgi:SAM-dependent methyltransferase